MEGAFAASARPRSLTRNLDDASGPVRGFDVSRDRSASLEVKIAFDAESEAPAKQRKLFEADGAEFGAARADIAEAPRDSLVAGIDFRQEPGRTSGEMNELLCA